jgi:ribosomal protein S24E
MEVLEEKDNHLFARKEVVALFEAVSTPSRKSVLEELGKKFGAKHDCIVIDKVEHAFGRKTARIFAKIYSTPEQARKFERNYKFARGAEKKKAGEQAAEQPQQEAAAAAPVPAQ